MKDKYKGLYIYINGYALFYVSCSAKNITTNQEFIIFTPLGSSTSYIEPICNFTLVQPHPDWCHLEFIQLPNNILSLA